MPGETVYDADTWPVVACSGRLPELRDWLRANGVDPSDVPVHEDITVEPLTLDGTGRVIRFTAYLRNAAGRLYLDEATGDAAREERIVPLVVDPPPQRREKENDR
ncbi:hypothetical protein QFZ75_003690 [Streptomyces sp. V3I8]|uniref:hypothetical protein n=1 Tax=Streptomyces sp. V3I8 TaxID=3042279 RepID=UPI00278A79CE|nr:hypothetical protein [Streptomyces sp. V3I8]MDQ1037274.1 hypothetical protein [Streptomyces sp. V3I8]